jgi:AAA domain
MPVVMLPIGSTPIRQAPVSSSMSVSPARNLRGGRHWFGTATFPPEPPPYLVDETVPQTGIAIIAGQFGVGKTFAGINLAAAVITGGQFAGREVKRRGGVLWLAAEGQNEAHSRFKAAIAHDGLDSEERYPFVRQAEGVPLLTEADALSQLQALAKEAADGMRSRFGCDLVLIVIDTLSGAAGFDDENSASETQKVINLLRELSTTTDALVAVIDHHGKVAETGVRGSSAKSAGADAILAFLGERDPTGTVGNRRMAVAKLRSGPSGRVVNFSLEPYEGTCVVNWRLDHDAAFQPEPEKLPKGLTLFKRALDNALAEFGTRTRPFPDGPEVVAVDRKAVRAEFMKIYPAENTKAKTESFLRCEKDAAARSIIGCHDDGEVTLFWSTKGAATV